MLRIQFLASLRRLPLSSVLQCSALGDLCNSGNRITGKVLATAVRLREGIQIELQSVDRTVLDTLYDVRIAT